MTAHDLAALEPVERLQVMALQPGDVLIVKCAHRLSEHQRKLLGEPLARAFPSHVIVVLDSGIELIAARVAQ